MKTHLPFRNMQTVVAALLCVCLLVPLMANPDSEAIRAAITEASSVSRANGDTARIRQFLRTSDALLPNDVPGAASSALEAHGLITARTSPWLRAQVHNAVAAALLPQEGGTRVRMHLEKALHFAKRAKDAAGQAEALCGLAELGMRVAQYDSCRTLLERAQQLADRATSDNCGGRVQYCLGELDRRQKQWFSAYEHFLKAVAYYSSAENCEQQIKALVRLASTSHLAKATIPIDAVKVSKDSIMAMARAMSDSCGGTRSRSMFVMFSGEFSGRNGNQDLACEQFEDALTLAENAGDIVWQLRVLQDLAINHTRRKLYDEAIGLYRRLIRLCETVGAEVTAAEALSMMGLSINDSGDPQAAEPYFHDVYNRYDALRDTVRMFHAMSLLASNLYAQNRDEKAMETYYKLFELAKKNGSRLWHRCSLLDYGQVEFLRKRYRNARDAFLEAEQYLEHGKETQHHANLYGQLARVNRRLKNWDLALDYYSRAIPIFEKIGDNRNVITCLAGPAYLYLERGSETGSMADLRQSLDLYYQVLNRAESVNYKPYIAISHHNIGLLLTKLHQPQKALGHLHAALAYRKKFGRKRHVARLTGTIGRALLQLGKPEAYDTLDHALELFDDVSDSEGLRAFYRNAALDLEDKSDHKRALAYYRRYTALRDSALSKEHISALNELNVRYETVQREREIELLKKQKSIDRLRLQQQKDELQRRALLDEHRRQNMLLLERENQIQKLQLAEKRSALNMQRLRSAKDSSDAVLWKQRSALKEASLGRQQALIAGLAAALLLLLAIAWLIYRRIQGRRREAALRADAAEYKAAAAESEQHRLAAAHERREKDMQRTVTRRLIETQEQERQRIASDLHDSLGQELVVIKNRAMLAAQKSGDVQALKRQLNEVISMTGTAMNTVREISHDLRPTELDRLGLSATLRSVVQKAQDSLPRGIEADIDPIDGLFDKEEEIFIFRIVQEALSNVIRHANASLAEVHARVADDELAITVRDDGRGIPTASESNGGNGDGMGLRGMQERAAILGGTMTVTSARDEGTRLHVRLPLRPVTATQASTGKTVSAD